MRRENPSSARAAHPTAERFACGLIMKVDRIFLPGGCHERAALQRSRHAEL
jgi:hypothetical protein